MSKLYKKQLPLNFRIHEDARFDNFIESTNQIAIAACQQVVQGAEPFAYFFGAEGCGRSHLLQAACHYAEQLGKSSVYVPLSESLSFSPELLLDLDAMDLVCVDDVDAIAGQKQWEEALMHLYNGLRAQGKGLLVTAKNKPNDTPDYVLEDLRSRLNWGALFQLQALTDEDKIIALQMRASHRGMTLSSEVGQYLLRHGPRHIKKLFYALDDLDRASLQAQRKLTKPFVKEVLGI